MKITDEKELQSFDGILESKLQSEIEAQGGIPFVKEVAEEDLLQIMEHAGADGLGVYLEQQRSNLVSNGKKINGVHVNKAKTIKLKDKDIKDFIVKMDSRIALVQGAFAVYIGKNEDSFEVRYGYRNRIDYIIELQKSQPKKVVDGDIINQICRFVVQTYYRTAIKHNIVNRGTNSVEPISYSVIDENEIRFGNKGIAIYPLGTNGKANMTILIEILEEIGGDVLIEDGILKMLYLPDTKKLHIAITDMH